MLFFRRFSKSLSLSLAEPFGGDAKSKGLRLKEPKEFKVRKKESKTYIIYSILKNICYFIASSPPHFTDRTSEGLEN